MAMIQIDNLEVVYPNGTRALAPTTLSIEKGRFTVLLGSSGAGKSTLLRTLNGLVRPTAGDIAVDGVGVLRGRHTMRAHRRAHRHGVPAAPADRPRDAC